jgi:hypothetical protein
MSDHAVVLFMVLECVAIFTDETLTVKALTNVFNVGPGYGRPRANMGGHGSGDSCKWLEWCQHDVILTLTNNAGQHCPIELIRQLESCKHLSADNAKQRAE